MAVERLLPRVKVPVLPMPTYVKLAEAFGIGAGTSLYDKSRYRSHGAITGATWAAGAHGYCLDFNPATPDYVTIPAAHTHLDFTTEDFSAIMRIRVDSLAADRNFLEKGIPATNGYRFRADNTGQINFGTSPGVGFDITRSANGAIVINTWYTLGFSRNGTSVTLYRNGVDITNVAGVHADPASAVSPLYIGIATDLATSPFDGKIEFLRIFGGIALAASEHLACHNALA